MPDCECGSEPRPGAPPYLVLRFKDVASPRVLRAYGAQIRVPISPNSPVFLASAKEFCSAPASSSHAHTGGFDALLNGAIDRLWSGNCKCKRSVAVRLFQYVILFKGIDATTGEITDKVFPGSALVTEPISSASFTTTAGFGGQIYRPIVVHGDPPVESQLAGVYIYEFTKPQGKVLSFQKVSFTCPSDPASVPGGVEPPPPVTPWPAPIISLPEIPAIYIPGRDPDKIVTGFPGEDDECCC